MAEDRTYFTINLPQRCRPKLNELAARSMRSRPQVLEALIEQALWQPELVGIPALPEDGERERSQQDAA
ncbi:MAG TPA: hypothetical protein PLJ35_15785 [Anaerolineae bacterium]|nr:hypothetical protein [Anaerolineae bacterium]HOR00272.1 hypothetical protein [Anaerolineae bacterium]